MPTEIDSSWNPAGDDNRGSGVWLWTSKEYDWKGRVTRTIPSDSTGTDGKDILISYAGCGCAGGEVVSLRASNADFAAKPAAPTKSAVEVKARKLQNSRRVTCASSSRS